MWPLVIYVEHFREQPSVVYKPLSDHTEQLCHRFKHLHRHDGRRCRVLRPRYQLSWTRCPSPKQVDDTSQHPEVSNLSGNSTSSACVAPSSTQPSRGGDLENSAGGPTGKEGRSFIVDLVLEECAGCALPVALSPPPTHFHLKTHNDCCVDPTPVQTFPFGQRHTCPWMSLQKPVGRPCTRRARLHWWVRPFRRFSGPPSSPSSSCSPPSQRVSITTLPCGVNQPSSNSS